MRNREALARAGMAAVYSDFKPVTKATRTFNLAGDIIRQAIVE